MRLIKIATSCGQPPRRAGIEIPAATRAPAPRRATGHTCTSAATLHGSIDRVLAAAESKALQDKMRAILKVMKDEVDGRRGGARLNDGDAKTWFGDLSKTAGALKDALDKIAADVNQPKATRDAAKERSDRVKSWIDKLDVIKAGGSFGTRDLVVP